MSCWAGSCPRRWPRARRGRGGGRVGAAAGRRRLRGPSGRPDGAARGRRPGRPADREWFTLAWFHLPDELRVEVAAAGFTQVQVLAVEGVGAAGDTASLLDDPETRRVLLDTIRRLESEPTLLGASPHLMAVGQAG